MTAAMERKGRRWGGALFTKNGGLLDGTGRPTKKAIAEILKRERPKRAGDDGKPRIEVDVPRVRR